jgi:hypothetical protein
MSRQMFVMGRMMFSADDIETLQQIFVQAFCFDGQSKFPATKFVVAVK